MEPTTYAEVLTGNFRAAMARADLSQEEVAARMRGLGFGTWRYQTVGQVRAGRRRLTAEEVMGLAWVLRTSITALMTPPAELGELRLQSGDLISARSVALLTHAYNDDAVTWHGTEPEFRPVSGDVTARIMVVPRLQAPPQ